MALAAKMQSLLAALAWMVLSVAGAAEGLDDFSWSFTGQASSSAVKVCDTISITMHDGSMSLDDATPPFTMFAYPSTGGLPIMQTLGTGTKLSWQVLFPTGSQIVMNIYDAAGRSAGWVAPYSVLAGTDTSCLPTSTDSDVTLKINGTSLSPCDILGVSASGGTPPYVVNVLPFGGLSDTLNYTLPEDDTWYNWVANVTSPNTLMVGLRDSNNVFALSPPLLQITGANATCSATSFAESSAPDSGSSDSTGSATIGGISPTNVASSGGGGGGSNGGAIAGGVVGGLAAIGIIAGALWFFLRRQRKREGGGGGGAASKLEKGNAQRSTRPQKLGKAGAADGIAGGDGRRVKTVRDRDDSAAEKNDAPDAAITPFTGGTADAHPLPGSPHLGPSRSTAKRPVRQRTAPAGPSSTRPSTAETQGTRSGRNAANFVLANPDPDESPERMGGPSTRRGDPNAAAIAEAQEEDKNKRPGTPPERRYLQHEDAGVYTPARDEPPEEIPPSYDSVRK